MLKNRLRSDLPSSQGDLQAIDAELHQASTTKVISGPRCREGSRSHSGPHRPSLDRVGPVTRTVRDAAILLG
jgi:hypothetical protein